MSITYCSDCEPRIAALRAELDEQQTRLEESMALLVKAHNINKELIDRHTTFVDRVPAVHEAWKALATLPPNQADEHRYRLTEALGRAIIALLAVPAVVPRAMCKHVHPGHHTCTAASDPPPDEDTVESMALELGRDEAGAKHVRKWLLDVIADPVPQWSDAGSGYLRVRFRLPDGYLESWTWPPEWPRGRLFALIGREREKGALATPAVKT